MSNSFRAASSAAPLGPGARQGNTAFAVSVAVLLMRLALGWTFIFHGCSWCLGYLMDRGSMDLR